jgi:serine-type D-Ala-D-Ala carboxypeptidase (penicillin-binding protein 5/6)
LRRPVWKAVSGLCVLAALAAALVTSPSPAAHASGNAPPPPRIAARAWILVDAGDGTRLAARAPTSSYPMASTTKLMTAHLALERLPPDRLLVAPPYHPIPGESLLGLEAGERISVRDLLYGLLLPSGNDAAVALADGVAGSVPDFVEEMNNAARRLGLHDTSYANPIGLDAPGNYSSPRDLAKLALDLRRNSLFRKIVNTPRITLRTGARPRTIANHNDLVLRVRWINGVKTGYTGDAGNVLVASGTRKGVTLLSVVMGAPTISARDRDSLDLLDYGFSLYSRRTPVSTNERLARPEVPNGDRRLPLVAARSVRLTTRRGEHVDVDVHVHRPLRAPIARHQRLGGAVVSVDGKVAGRTPLLAGRAAHVATEASVVARVDDAVPGPRGVVWAIAAGIVAAIAVWISVALTRHR